MNAKSNNEGRIAEMLRAGKKFIYSLEEGFNSLIVRLTLPVNEGFFFFERKSYLPLTFNIISTIDEPRFNSELK